MSSIIDAIAVSNPLGAIVELGGKIIDRVIPDTEAAAKAKLDLIQLQQNGELAQMANDANLYQVEQ